jgi:ssDNA thymidine ADP-ribosyltransferase, DarT
MKPAGGHLMPVPDPITLYRLVHVETLPTLLTRGALHAPNCTPHDGLGYRTIHSVTVQASRHNRPIRCGPHGTCHDYVPFYFGPLSVMLLNLKTGRVEGYDQGQAPLIYLTTTLQRVQEAGCQFVFSDGHGLARITDYYDDLRKLDQVDWNLVGERYWRDLPDDNDRQRRKQAELLVWNSLEWVLIESIGVMSEQVKARVEAVLDAFPQRPRPRVEVRREWYYY